jgi:hypothetical protein
MGRSFLKMRSSCLNGTASLPRSRFRYLLKRSLQRHLLTLVEDDALPWLPEVQQSMVRHRCKHLLAIVMEWLPAFDANLVMERIRRNDEMHEQWMAWSERRLERYRQGNPRPDPDDPEPVEEAVYFPAEVSKALNIYRHQEIERLRRHGDPWMDADWDSGKARKIADGLLDRKKQSGLYVDVTKTGEIGLHPGLITREEASEAIKRAEYFSESTPITCSDEYKKLKEIISLIFSNLKDTSKQP